MLANPEGAASIAKPAAAPSLETIGVLPWDRICTVVQAVSFCSGLMRYFATV